MRWTIHIGAPKTGSTAIQRFLTDNRHALLARGVLYPDVSLRALHAWFLESDWDGARKWATLHAEPIMRNGFAAFYAGQGMRLPDAYAAFA